MPVTNSKQARIDLTTGQAAAIATLIELLVSASDTRAIAGLGIEETNLPGTVAVLTAEAKNRTFLVHKDGSIHEFGSKTVDLDF